LPFMSGLASPRAKRSASRCCRVRRAPEPSADKASSQEIRRSRDISTFSETLVIMRDRQSPGFQSLRDERRDDARLFVLSFPRKWEAKIGNAGLDALVRGHDT
jgi:hypothetical protein